MDIFLLIAASASLLLCAYLLYRLISLVRGIGRLSGLVADIRKTGFRRRVHLGFGDRSLKGVGTELNELMDEFQRTLEDKQRLELSHKQLVANISHDIRTPLTSLLGYVEVLREQELGSEERKEYLDIAYAKALAMHRMIEEFFDLARLESEDAVMELSPIDLAEILRETLASYYQPFTQASITPEITLPEGAVMVWGNRAGIERVLENLISNALKYGGDGGMIGVSLRAETGRAWVDVTDRGRGISQDELPYVFDRLYTAEASRNAARRGTGLGLAIARKLVTGQNGEIHAASMPGEATTFSFCLNKVQNV